MMNNIIKNFINYLINNKKLLKVKIFNIFKLQWKKVELKRSFHRLILINLSKLITNFNKNNQKIITAKTLLLIIIVIIIILVTILVIQ